MYLKSKIEFNFQFHRQDKNILEIFKKKYSQQRYDLLMKIRYEMWCNIGSR